MALVPLSLIFSGCCSNVVTLEHLIRRDSGAGHLITFAQFVFVALVELFTSQLEWTPKKEADETKGSNSTKGATQDVVSLSSRTSSFPIRLSPRHIPLSYHLFMVAIFFIVSVLNNKALDYQISLPLHMVFRSGSLIANIVMGFVVFRRRYSFLHVFSMVLVTMGITLATLASYNVESVDDSKYEENEDANATQFWIGIALLTTAALLSACLGLIQDHVYGMFGRGNSRQALFYSHFLALPMFLFFSRDIYHHIIDWHHFEEQITVPFFGSVSVMFVYLAANLVTQYFCIRGVFLLISTTNALTGTLAISLRKFVSLIVSIFYFNNAFTSWHWASIVCVFSGTFLYCYEKERITKSVKAMAEKAKEE